MKAIISIIKTIAFGMILTSCVFDAEPVIRDDKLNGTWTRYAGYLNMYYLYHYYQLYQDSALICKYERIFLNFNSNGDSIYGGKIELIKYSKWEYESDSLLKFKDGIGKISIYAEPIVQTSPIYVHEISHQSEIQKCIYKRSIHIRTDSLLNPDTIIVSDSLKYVRFNY